MILCENCFEREASFHIQQTIQGNKQQLHLCQECARELGYSSGQGTSFLFNPQSGGGSGLFNISNLWSQLFGVPPEELSQLFQFGQSPGMTAGGFQDAVSQTTCENCGMSMKDFAATALLGCPQCYTSFKESMDSLLKRVQAGNRHMGRRLQGTEPVDMAFAEADGNEMATDANDWQQQLQALQEQQEAAVDKEDYEEAARIRDAIRALKQAREDKHE